MATFISREAGNVNRQLFLIYTWWKSASLAVFPTYIPDNSSPTLNSDSVVTQAPANGQIWHNQAHVTGCGERDVITWQPCEHESFTR